MSSPQHKQQREHEVIAFGDPASASVADAVMYTMSTEGYLDLLRKNPLHFERVQKYYDPKTIYIGSQYPKERIAILLARIKGYAIKRRARGATEVMGAPTVAMTYHPSHLISAISHEKLHQVLNPISRSASRAIDQYAIFGGTPSISPTGIIDYEVLRERMLAKKAGRLSK